MLYRLVITFTLIISCHALFAAENPAAISSALKRAGTNRSQIQAALDRSPAKQREGMQFLIAHMPDHDLKTLPAEFLLENVRLAYQAREESSWKANIPNDIPIMPALMVKILYGTGVNPATRIIHIP